MYIASKIDRRKKKIRHTIKKQFKYRLTVYKSNKHTYAQLYNPDCNLVILSMSTLDKNFKLEISKCELDILNKVTKSKMLANLLAIKIKEMNIKNIVFDRSGFKFHGRIKAVAETINKNGIIC